MHRRHIFKEEELDESATCKDFLQVQQEGSRMIKRKQKNHNLDAIISVGYRIKSKRATRFRIWATQRLKKYLIQGYTINEKRLAQKQQEIQTLKDGIRILSRATEEQSADKTDKPIISNEALATMTLFVVTSKLEEMETVKKLTISVLNRR